MGIPDTRTGDGFDVQVQTNHLSHFLLTSLLMPALEAAASSRGESRVVQHSSGARGAMMGNKSLLEERFFVQSDADTLGGDQMPACFGRYHQTKLANPVFAMALHERLQAAGSKVKSLCCEPGASATELGTSMMSQHARQAEAKGTPIPSSPFGGSAKKKEEQEEKEPESVTAMKHHPKFEEVKGKILGGEDPQAVVMGLMSTEPDLAKLIVANQDAFKALLTEKPVKPKAEKRPKHKPMKKTQNARLDLTAVKLTVAAATITCFYLPKPGGMIK